MVNYFHHCQAKFNDWNKKMIACKNFSMEKITAEMEKRISKRFEELREAAGLSYYKVGVAAFGYLSDPKSKAMNLLNGDTRYTFADFCRLCCVFGIDPGKLFMSSYDEASAAMPENTTCQEIFKTACANKKLKKGKSAAA